MKTGHYTVIRFNADPARNELRNVGIMVWNDDDFRLHVSPDSIARVVRENPQLHFSALDWIEEGIRSRLDDCKFSPDRAEAVINESPGFPVTFSEPLMTALESDGSTALDITLKSLVSRIVLPRSRTATRAANPVTELAERLSELISTKVVLKNYRFEHSATGIRRQVDFYANSTTNAALAPPV